MAALEKQMVALAVCNMLEYNIYYGQTLSNCRKLSREGFMGCEPFIFKVHEAPILLCGSHAEGLLFMTSKFGMKADMDVLLVLDTSIAHRDTIKETRDASEVHQLLIQPSKGNPGYVLLTLIKEGRMDDLFSEVTTWDEDCLYLSNNMWLDQISKAREHLSNICPLPESPSTTGFHHQGPSEAMGIKGYTMGLTNGFEIDKHDYVPAIPCSEWPPEADEWLTRRRKFSWPPEEVISKIKQGGSYLVPVGCEGSPHQDVEWKYSFSHSEKHLIWSLSPVQFKCYMVLKLLRIYVLSQLHGEIISSYIIKTSLLWTVEETDPDHWTPPMLLDCAKRCLIRIRNWVTEDFCPNYIMVKCNLLRNRYKAEQKDQVLETLTDLINNLEARVLNLPPFIKELQNNSLETLAQENTPLMQIMKMSNPMALKLTSQQEAAIHSCSFNFRFKQCYGTAAANTDLQSIRSSLITEIQTLSSNLQSDDINNIGLKMLLTAKTHMLSLFLQLSDPVRQENAKVLESMFSLKETCQPVSGKVFLVNRLYLATVHLSMGYIQGALEAVKTVDEYFQKNPYLVADHEKITYQLLGQGTNHVKDCFKAFGLITNKHAKTHAALPDNNVYINDVHFAFAESPYLPKPIQYEVILRANVDNVTDGLPIALIKSITSIDPLVYSCFIQFWCHRQVQNNVEQLKVIKSLQERCEDGMTTNKDTAWNLLGYCHQTVGQYRGALSAYFQALRYNPMNTASKFYVSILVNKVMREKLV